MAFNGFSTFCVISDLAKLVFFSRKRLNVLQAQKPVEQDLRKGFAVAL